MVGSIFVLHRALDAQEHIYSANVLPEGISVGVGEGPIQLTMGDYSC